MATICIQVPDPVPSREIRFAHDGTTSTAMARPYDTSFYIITAGKHNGSLVHIFDILNLYQK